MGGPYEGQSPPIALDDSAQCRPSDDTQLALRGAEQVQSLGFLRMLEQLISSGGDTDTIASIAGQIAGTVLGYSSLPVPLVERLPEREVVSNIAVKFIFDPTRTVRQSSWDG
jgi:ADP-ribosylglycohydrolase